MTNSLSDLESCLENGGLRGGLGFLNSRVSHRFTGVYRLESQVMHVVHVVDKSGESCDNFLQAVPLHDSFCQFVLRDGFLRTSQTSSLAMLDGGPYQGVLESYVGLPLMTGHGELYGTFCHFDFSSEPVSDEEYLFLQKAVLLIPRFLRHAARSKTDPSLRLQVPGR